MSSEEKLRALLAEAREVVASVSETGNADYELKLRIDAALAEPVGARTDYLPSDEPADAYSDGMWEALFAAQRERDEARAEVERLRWANEMGCENTPTKGCECPGCGLARERAERGEAGPCD